MLDNLLNLIKGNSKEAVTDNPVIPNEKNNLAVESAGASILSTLKNAVAGGHIQEVLAYFKKHAIGSASGRDEPIVKKATEDYSNSLQQDLQLDKTEASAIADKVIPASMGQLAAKTVDPADNSFSLQDIFDKLSGGKSDKINFQQMLQNFDGGKLDHNMDGKVDGADLKSMFSGDDGLINKIKGFLK